MLALAHRQTHKAQFGDVAADGCLRDSYAFDSQALDDLGLGGHELFGHEFLNAFLAMVFGQHSRHGFWR